MSSGIYQRRTGPYADAANFERTNGKRTRLEDVPKSVWAAVAISLASRLQPSGCDGPLEECAAICFEEWWTLYHNGIVEQKPPFPLSELKGGAA